MNGADEWSYREWLQRTREGTDVTGVPHESRHHVSTATTLENLGFPVSAIGLVAAVAAFQAGYAFGAPLTVDGIDGPLTRAALTSSGANGLAGPHFGWDELACSCHRPACPVLWPKRSLILGLERLRAAAYPGGLVLRSACRCRAHNAEVGGAPDSQHIYGRAADVPPDATAADVERLKTFGGIGYSSAYRVVHVDTRPEPTPPFRDGP